MVLLYKRDSRRRPESNGAEKGCIVMFVVSLVTLFGV